MKKPWYQSLTILGALAFSLVQTAETLGVLPSGTVAELSKVATGLVTLYGLRRAAG